MVGLEPQGFGLPKWLTDAGNTVGGAVNWLGDKLINNPISPQGLVKSPFMPIKTAEGRTIFPTEPGYMDEKNRQQLPKTIGALSMLTGGIAGGLTGSALIVSGVLDVAKPPDQTFSPTPAPQPAPQPHAEPEKPPVNPSVPQQPDPLAGMMNMMMTIMMANMMFSMIPSLSAKKRKRTDEFEYED